VILGQVAIGIGVAFWRLEHGEATPLPIRSDDVAAIATGTWAGWRKFRVESNAFEDHIRTQRS